jgi:arsenate reductase-like glutaredoxin family protein
MSDAQVLLVNDTAIRPEARTQLLSMIAKVREAFEQVVVERDELWRELESTQRMLAEAQRDDGEAPS